MGIEQIGQENRGYEGYDIEDRDKEPPYETHYGENQDNADYDDVHQIH